MKIVATTRSILLRGRSCSKPGTHKFCLCRISSGARCRSAEALGALMSFPMLTRNLARLNPQNTGTSAYTSRRPRTKLFSWHKKIQVRNLQADGGSNRLSCDLGPDVYPILILGAALVMIPLLPHFHRSQSHQEEVISPTSHEPFHFSLSVLPPLKAPANRS